MVVDIGTWMRNALYLAQSEVYRCLAQRDTEDTELFCYGGRYRYVDAKCPLSRTEDAEDAELFCYGGRYRYVDAKCPLSRTERGLSVYHTEDAEDAELFCYGGRYRYVDAKCPLSRTEGRRGR